MPMTQIHWMLLATGYKPKSKVGEAIGRLCGYGSEVFLHQIRENLLESFPGTDRLLPTVEIIKNAYKGEALSFVCNIKNEPAILLYNSHVVRKEMLKAFTREHVSACGFVNSANRLEMVSSGCLHSQVKREVAGKYGPFLCSYRVREAEQNFQDAVLPHNCVITDEPFMVDSRQ